MIGSIQKPGSVMSRAKLLYFVVWVIITIVIALGIEKYRPTTSADVASWVQAIGTIFAFVGAIIVASEQYERSRHDDHEETKAFVGAVVEELKTIWQGYSADTRKRLLEVTDDGFLDLIYPVSSDAFTIYNGFSGRVGKVDDPELRRLIVQVYAQAKGLVSSYQLNNEMVRAYWAMNSAFKASDDVAKARSTVQRKHLQDYVRKLKGRDKLIEADLKALFKRADEYINAKPALCLRRRTK